MIRSLSTADRIVIAEEAVADIIESELWPLLTEHREELTTNKDLMVLAPDVERYRTAETAGAMFSLVARDSSGTVVGYSVNFIGQHLHYSGLRYAHNDVLFLTAPHRLGSLGLRLQRATRETARRLGAQVMTWHAKPGTTLEAILRRRDRCRVQDVLFTEEI